MAITRYAVATELANPKTANVAEIYRNSTLAEIRADLDERRSALVNICMNLSSDFNCSSVIRANNALLGQAVYLIGKRHYDRRGTVGTHQYERVFHAPELSEVVEKLHADGYTILAVDNQPEYNPINIWDAELPEKVAFVYGEEQRGLQPEDIALCDGMVFVAQKGSVRSLNVAQAAAVLMAEYTRRHG